VTTHNDHQRRVFLRGYAKGRQSMRRQLEAELKATKAAHDELRNVLLEWRASVEARRAAEAAIVDFWRNAHAQRHLGASLH
jgi:hypothetical protein